MRVGVVRKLSLFRTMLQLVLPQTRAEWGCIGPYRTGQQCRALWPRISLQSALMVRGAGVCGAHSQPDMLMPVRACTARQGRAPRGGAPCAARDVCCTKALEGRWEAQRASAAAELPRCAPLGGSEAGERTLGGRGQRADERARRACAVRAASQAPPTTVRACRLAG